MQNTAFKKFEKLWSSKLDHITSNFSRLCSTKLVHSWILSLVYKWVSYEMLILLYIYMNLIPFKAEEKFLYLFEYLDFLPSKKFMTWLWGFPYMINYINQFHVIVFFYNLWKHQKTSGFLTYRKRREAVNGLIDRRRISWGSHWRALYWTSPKAAFTYRK